MCADLCSGAAGRLVGGDDEAADAVVVVDGPQRHDRDGRRAVRVRDQAGRADRRRVDLGHLHAETANGKHNYTRRDQGPMVSTQACCGWVELMKLTEGDRVHVHPLYIKDA